MSLTDEIKALTNAARDLTQRVDGWVADADAALTAAIAAVPDLMRTIYVDPAAGDDAADGRMSTSALASLERALELVTPVRWTEIVVMGDLAWNSNHHLVGSKVYVRSDNPAVRRRVDIGLEANLISWEAAIRFEDMHLALPPGAANPKNVVWPAGFTSLVFRNCTVEYSGFGDVCLASRGYGGLSLTGIGITSVNMAGRWLREAPAGININAVAGVISSIANV